MDSVHTGTRTSVPDGNTHTHPSGLQKGPQDRTMSFRVSCSLILARDVMKYASWSIELAFIPQAHARPFYEQITLFSSRTRSLPNAFEHEGTHAMGFRVSCCRILAHDVRMTTHNVLLARRGHDVLT